MNRIQVVLLSGMMVLAANPAVSETITFNNYVSATNNDLANNFSQTGAIVASPYIQSTNGGISGGSVVGYSGNDYRATAVYTPHSFTLAGAGSSVTQSLDLYYNAQFVPLAPGANAVRSFRIGLLGDNNAAFETVGNSSVYMEGVYSLASNQMLLVARSQSGGILTSISLASIDLTANHWYQVGATFTNQGNGDIQYTGTLFDLGPSGVSTPTALAAWDWSYQNNEMIADSSAFAGFSALADGGIGRADNFTVPSAVPELSTWAMMILGFTGVGYVTYRRRRIAAL